MRWRNKRDDGSVDDDRAQDAPTDGAEAPTEPAAMLRETGGDATPRPGHPVVPVDLGAVDDADLARAVRRAVVKALTEDLGGRGDVTSSATVPADARGRAQLVARDAGVVAGTAVITEVCAQVDHRIAVRLEVADGARVAVGDVVAEIEGPLRTVLTAERTLLNLVCQLSGVATHTAAFADALAGTGCAVRDTRKTTPGLRLLEKAAVAAGGGANHRVGLYDAILVKDNHVAAAGGVRAASVAALAAGARDGIHVQVEVTTVDEALEAIEAGVTDLLLDNMTPDELREAVRVIDGRAAVEASGGITLETCRAYALAGADRIAVGALTHSAPALDLALDVVEVTRGTDRREAAAAIAAATDAVDEPDAEDASGADEPDDRVQETSAATPDADSSDDAADGSGDADGSSEDPAVSDDADGSDEDADGSDDTDGSGEDAHVSDDADGSDVDMSADASDDED